MLDKPPAPQRPVESSFVVFRYMRHQQIIGAEAQRYAEDGLETLWSQYIAHGGTAGPVEFEAYVYAALVMPRFELMVLEQTLWELRNFAA